MMAEAPLIPRTRKRFVATFLSYPLIRILFAALGLALFLAIVFAALEVVALASQSMRLAHLAGILPAVAIGAALGLADRAWSRLGTAAGAIAGLLFFLIAGYPEGLGLVQQIVLTIVAMALGAGSTALARALVRMFRPVAGSVDG